MPEQIRFMHTWTSRPKYEHWKIHRMTSSKDERQEKERESMNKREKSVCTLRYWIEIYTEKIKRKAILLSTLLHIICCAVFILNQIIWNATLSLSRYIEWETFLWTSFAKAQMIRAHWILCLCCVHFIEYFHLHLFGILWSFFMSCCHLCFICIRLNETQNTNRINVNMDVPLKHFISVYRWEFGTNSLLLISVCLWLLLIFSLYNNLPFKLWLHLFSLPVSYTWSTYMCFLGNALTKALFPIIICTVCWMSCFFFSSKFVIIPKFRNVHMSQRNTFMVAMCCFEGIVAMLVIQSWYLLWVDLRRNHYEKENIWQCCSSTAKNRMITKELTNKHAFGMYITIHSLRWMWCVRFMVKWQKQKHISNST